MEQVFKKLKEMQEILSKKFEIDRDIKELPKILNTKLELLARMKKSYIEKTNDLNNRKQRVKDIKQKLSEAEIQKDKYEQQMDLVKTQREYEALDKEIKTSADKEQELRRQLQKEEKNCEEMVVGLEREENMIKEQEEEIRTEQTKIKHEIKEKNKVQKLLEKDEQRVSPGLDEEILFKFERIIRSKAGLGIVPIKNGICTGCHMILTAQFSNDVRGGTSIMFCPNCSRILFFQESDEE
jgi:predicted  nucleic acid-binding Zn-ribbon protein